MPGEAIKTSSVSSTHPKESNCTFHKEYLAIPVAIAAIIGVGILMGWVILQSGYHLPGNWTHLPIQIR